MWGTDRPTGVFDNGDVFKVHGTAHYLVTILAEGLPPGSRLTSASYLEVMLLDLQRNYGENPTMAFTFTRESALVVDGQRANVLDYIQGAGSGALDVTAVEWLERGRAWTAQFTSTGPGPGHKEVVPVFETMVKTFHATG
jgi:hypothetical protein